jgi:hypothetical protein
MSWLFGPLRAAVVARAAVAAIGGGVVGGVAGALPACTLVQGEAVAALSDGDCGPDTKACPVPGTFDDERCVSIFDPTTSCGLVGNCAPCFFENGTATCGPDGTCALESCDFGFRNCAGAVGVDLCQTDTRTDPRHCGDCDRACGANNGVAGCTNATCTIACAAGFGNCNQVDPSVGDDDGCETPLDSNDHCGDCDEVCDAGTQCTLGRCQ